MDFVLGLAGRVGLGGGRKALQAERKAWVMTDMDIPPVGGTGSRRECEGDGLGR